MSKRRTCERTDEQCQQTEYNSAHTLQRLNARLWLRRDDERSAASTTKHCAVWILPAAICASRHMMWLSLAHWCGGAACGVASRPTLESVTCRRFPAVLSQSLSNVGFSQPAGSGCLAMETLLASIRHIKKVSGNSLQPLVTSTLAKESISARSSWEFRPVHSRNRGKLSTNTPPSAKAEPPAPPRVGCRDLFAVAEPTIMLTYLFQFSRFAAPVAPSMRQSHW